MSLALLVPLFLLGVAGVVVPIVLHLTRRQRRNLVQFPSLMFLEKIPYKEQRRRRIHYWFLLTMRALALALVAIAFARPFFQQDTAGAGAAHLLYTQGHKVGVELRPKRPEPLPPKPPTPEDYEAREPGRGRLARRPEQIPHKGWIDILWRTGGS